MFMQYHKSKSEKYTKDPRPLTKTIGSIRYKQFVLSTLTFVITLSVLLPSCRREASNHANYTDAQRLQLDTTSNHTKNIDSLMHFVAQYREEGDRCREMAALAALGHGYQTASRYADAVKVHQEQLGIAEQLGDILMKASALNDIGVNYRRLGLYYDGLDYHMRAVETSLLQPEEETDEKMLKCRAIGYNGAGNVYLSIGNYKKADEMLRKALAIEMRLGSHLGMNVDLSNLGIVYERRGMLDSAWAYYKQSMHHSYLAESYTGQAYGHMNFGRLHALQGDYRKAIAKYHRSMDLVHKDRDLWIWMQPALALAEAYVDAGMIDSANYQLGLVEETAQTIGGKEYAPKIAHLYAKLHEKTGDYRKALTLHRHASAQEDSLLNARNLFEIETLQSQITNRYHAQINERKEIELQRERWIKRITLLVLIITSILLITALYVQRLRSKNLLALRQMATLREHFFTNITHEFRTPLTLILGLSHDLQHDKEASPCIQEKAKIIERQGNGLLTLINQLLDISKIQSSVGNPDWRRGNISAHIAMIVESYRSYAQSRHIDLQYLSKEEVTMDFVPDYANKVLNNLLSNAFKFTPEHGKVSIIAWRRGEYFFIDVVDTGIGMDKATQSLIFEPFYQAESDVRNVGTGVGLALVKQIIEAVKGTISVESMVGKGTTFHISVPILNVCTRAMEESTASNDPILPATTEERLTDHESEDDQCRLLVIEDNRDIATYIGSQLSDRYAIFYAGNGKEGLDKALEIVPDLIITDLMMPEMDGLELCREVRKNEIINHIPIIVVTAKVSDEERIRGIEAGADAYLTKPFNSDELCTRVEKLLDTRRLLRRKFAQSTAEACEEENRESDEVSAQRRVADTRFLSRLTDTVFLLMNRQKKLEIPAIASEMCMSYSQFYRKLISLTGLPPSEYVQRVRIQHAQQIKKKNPDLSYGEVAEQCGFNDYSTFVRAFKAVYGTTPSESEPSSKD